MNDDYIMHPGDRFVARECGCAMTVINGPASPDMALQAPRCCCGHEMMKDPTFIGGFDHVDIPEQVLPSPLLAGMVE